MERDAPLEKALSRRFATIRIAEACGITSQAVSKWKRVPKRHLAAVARLTGISAKRLRPDLAKLNGRGRK